jgi:hypothetical protein
VPGAVGDVGKTNTAVGQDFIPFFKKSLTAQKMGITYYKMLQYQAAIMSN